MKVSFSSEKELTVPADHTEFVFGSLPSVILTHAEHLF